MANSPPARHGAPASHAIRPPEADDLAEIARLHAAGFSEPWSVPALRDLLTDGHALALVAPGKGTSLEGFLLARRITDEAEILALAVDPPCRRTGIAQNLLTHLVDRLRSDLPCRLFLEVSVENAAAIALYERSGFHPVGRRKAYYHQPGRPPADAVTMALELSAHSADL